MTPPLPPAAPGRATAAAAAAATVVSAPPPTAAQGGGGGGGGGGPDMERWEAEDVVGFLQVRAVATVSSYPPSPSSSKAGFFRS